MPAKHNSQFPLNYQCPYRHCCPHLEGLSTQWVFSEYQNSSFEQLDHWKARDQLQEQLDEALQYIGQLEIQNEELKAKLKALHQKRFKANRKSEPKHNPEHNSASNTKKKRGAPKEHPGWQRRKPDHIDETLIVPAPEICPHLFTFLKYPQIQPTNNQAEQSLRYMVIFRKICFGTRSSQGPLSHSVLPSLLMTAKRQGPHPLTFFETLFTCDTATAQAALDNANR